MNQLVGWLVLFAGLGCEAACPDGPDMVYDFENVSPQLCRATPSEVFKQPDSSSRSNHRPT